MKLTSLPSGAPSSGTMPHLAVWRRLTLTVIAPAPVLPDSIFCWGPAWRLRATLACSCLSARSLGLKHGTGRNLVTVPVRHNQI